MNATVKVASTGILCLLLGITSTHASNTSLDSESDGTGAEFHMMRVKYRTYRSAGSHGIIQPMWAVDYPYAEEHFFPALRRSTKITVSDDEIHLELSDDRIFEYPFMFMQQPGAGGWNPTPNEAARLRQY